jgi:PQQ-dependent catabolism-associated CXXCW motif protein
MGIPCRRTIRRRIGNGLAELKASTSASNVFASDDATPEPAGYWQGAMNGKVPATIAGGSVIDTARLAQLVQRDNPVLIDVVPAPRRPLEQTSPWLPLPHRNIPRSVWIPGAGSGVISTAMTDYFRARLNDLTHHDLRRAIVFYCRVDCWASWNAAKRAIADGYQHVYWYPDGVEAWQAAGLQTETATAEGPGVQ